MSEGRILSLDNKQLRSYLTMKLNRAALLRRPGVICYVHTLLECPLLTVRTHQMAPIEYRSQFDHAFQFSEYFQCSSQSML